MWILSLSLEIATVYGQSFSLKGHLNDSANKKNIGNASILLLRPKDSILLRFTRSSDDGGFVIHNLPAGDYLLWITHSQFEIYRSLIKMPGDLGNIYLFPRSISMDTITVTHYRKILRIKGDTLEYDAANVKVKINGSVEDLLKRLPGIEVNQKGEISVQGEKIQKILIDGEEFFSEDPTITTRNISASMVDKVQVLNKSSPQAEFTGVQDGRTTKAINLTLRDDKKQGWFGKLDAGSDGQQTFNQNALVGSFKARRKLASFAIASNNGQLQLVEADAQNFDGGDLIDIPAGHGTGDNFGNSSSVGGVPKVINGGVHYSNDWNGDGFHNGQHLSINYGFGNSSNAPTSFTYNRQTLTDSLYEQVQQISSKNTGDRQSLSGIYDLALDSNSSLRISIVGLREVAHNQDSSWDSTFLNHVNVNTNLRLSDVHIANQNSYANIFWRRKFDKPGRTFSASIEFGKSGNHTYGYLFARTNLYQPDGSLFSRDTTDQFKDNNNNKTTISANTLYSTPLWSDNYVFLVGYYFAFTESEAFHGTYSRGNGKYNVYVDSLSGKYAYANTSQRFRLSTQIKEKQKTLVLGMDISYAYYRQKDLLADATRRYNYFNFFPYAQARWNISALQAINLNYFGNMRPPTIDQLQPSKNNNDPLNIVVGNPELKPTFFHRFNVGWNVSKPLAGRFSYVSIGFDFIDRAISNKSLIDSVGRTLTQSVNVDGNRNLNISWGSNWKLHFLDLKLGFNGSLNYSRSISFVNGQLNRSDNYAPRVGFSLDRAVPDKYGFSISCNYKFDWTRSSINPTAITHFWTSAWVAEFSRNLPLGMEFNTTATYSWRQKLSPSDQKNEFTLWNASLDKRFLQNTLTARFSINDILNQNTGISRSSTLNQYSETTFSTIHRYWLFSVIWRFRTKAKSNQ